MDAVQKKNVNDFDPANFFTKKELCYYKMIDNFFKNCNEDRIIKMLNIIDGQSDISLRVLDWFVTKYSKRGIDLTRDGDTFDVHINYKAQLKSYKKRYFDPFKRKRKFNYKYKVGNEERIMFTTIGQLNFFRWAISNDIIGFVEKYLQQITRAMNLSNKEDKVKKCQKNKTDTSDSSESDESDYTDDSKKSTDQIKVNAIKNIKDDEVELILCFD